MSGFNRKFTLLIVAAFLSVITSTSVLAAEFYTWIDENGVKHYSSEKPENAASKKIEVEAGRSDPYSDRGYQQRQASKNKSWINSALGSKAGYSREGTDRINCNQTIILIRKSINSELRRLLDLYKRNKISKKFYRSKKHNLVDIEQGLSYNQCLADRYSYYRCMAKRNDLKGCIRF